MRWNLDLKGLLDEHHFLFRGGPLAALVVGGDEHGGDDLRLGYAIGGGGDRGKQGHLGKLVLVGLGDRDGGGGDVFRPALAAGGGGDGR